jgi:hypothetical protein
MYLRIVPIAAAAALIACEAQAAERAWVQYVPGGLELRAITDAPACPQASVDGKAAAMQVRAAAGSAFPVTACALHLPAGAAQAMVGARAFPLPTHPARRILIFGDTGCRLKGKEVQACNDPRQWPFAEIAKRAAAMKPDVVIHVGDYYYRETACPETMTGCAGSPHGDNWTSWDADFFAPAQPLFDAAPWVMARGNHEDCKRGGQGWFRFLDAGAPPAECRTVTDAYTVDLGGLDLYVLDSADSAETTAPEGPVAEFAGQLDALKSDLTRGRGWIVTHRPIWAQNPNGSVINATEQAATKGRDLDGVQMVVSGHIHHFDAVDFGGHRPAQLVAGTGGDIGEPGEPITPQRKTVHIDDMDGQSFSFERFGYLQLERHGADWQGDFRDMDDKVIATCRLHGRRLACRARQ